jgi:transcriptional regulator with XRE-family HTH domain
MPTPASPELTFTVADNVRALCALRGITHRELARDSGLPEPTVSRWCTGVVRRPRAAQLSQICRAYDIPMERLTSPDGGYAAALALVCEARGGEPPRGLVDSLDLAWILERWHEQLSAQQGSEALG